MIERELRAEESSEHLKVVGGGYCIGCGGCAAMNPEGYQIRLDGDGMYQAEVTRKELDRGLVGICPFSNTSRNETDLAFSQDWGDIAHDPSIGHWRGLYAGHISDQDDRLSGGSGGLTTWLLRRLLASGTVDAVAHVKPVVKSEDPEAALFRYGISRTTDELDQGRKSRYYPIEMSAVLQEIRSRPGRYAVVALPCFAKTIRNLQENDPVLRDRITVIVGLVCGHLKSARFAEYLGWLTEVTPASLTSIDFRKKISGSPASRYTIEAATSSSAVVGKPLHNYFATSWEAGLMRYPACEYCDDVFAETADIVFGDAWISPLDADWRGYNVVITRDLALQDILEDGRQTKKIELIPLGVGEIVSTQAGGLRHRREGLSIRLAAAIREGRWVPKKRVEPLTTVEIGKVRKYLMRSELSLISHSAFRRARQLRSIFVFYLIMTLPVFRYYLTTVGFPRAVKETFVWKAIRRKFAARTF